MARIEHFAVFAADPSALKDFYVEALGLRLIVDNSHTSPPGYFLADDSGTAFEIIGRPADVPAADTRHVCHTAFLVDDLASARSALERRGLAFEAETVVDNDAMRTAFFRDPEGNRCQIVWRARPLVEPTA
jgi:glyoxylase I family protein